MSSLKILFRSLGIIAAPGTLFSQVDTGWVRYYDGPGHNVDVVRAIAIDGSNNVYVTGESMDPGGKYDYATLGYNSNGDTLWVRRFNGAADGDDRPTAIAVDKDGSVYIGGSSVTDFNCGYDFGTLKYASNGDLLWTRVYNGIGGNSADETRGMVVDDFGNVLAAGYSYHSLQSDPHDNFAIVKYDAVGVPIDTMTGGAADFYVTALACDHAGNSYVTGYATYVNSRYLVSLKYDQSLKMQALNWYMGTDDVFNSGHAVTTDDSSNYYVAGMVKENGRDWFTIIKYGPDGNQRWASLCNGPGGTAGEASDLVVDSQGRIFATGRNWTGGLNHHMFTIAYAPNGDTLWTAVYDGQLGNDVALAIALDSTGSVIVTGYSDQGTLHKTDIVTIAYDVDGHLLWMQRFNGPASSYDYGNAIVVDRAGSIYVAGQSVRAGTGVDFAVIKYVNSGDAVEENPGYLAAQFDLGQNYPNPFNPSTTIGYRVEGRGERVWVTLKVYDIIGREVATLVNERKQPGSYAVRFDAGGLASGVYLYRLTAGSFAESKKMVVVR